MNVNDDVLTQGRRQWLRQRWQQWQRQR